MLRRVFGARAGIWLAVSACAVCWVWPAPARAEVRIGDVRAGYEGHGRNGYAIPVAVELTNPDSADVSGVLAVRVPIPNSQPLVWSREVDLPAGAHKRVMLYPECPQYGSSGQDAAVLAFRPRRGPEVSTPLKLVQHASDSLLVLACTEGPAGGFAPIQSIDSSTWTGPRGGATPTPSPPGGGGASGRSDVYVAYTNTEGLPDSWKGFEGLDLLILDDFSTASITPDQEAGILDWISGGGRLLVTGGEDYQRLSESFLADYLPLEVTGAAVLSDGLPVLGEEFGGGLAAEPTAIVTGKLVRGRANLSQDGRPLISSCTVGLGKVWLMSFSVTNQPLKYWPGATEMMSRLLKVDRQYPAAVVASHADQLIANGLAVNAGAKPPSFRVISVFLLAYIIFLIPVNYFVLKRLDRRELAWATTPCIVVVFSVAAYGLGFVLRGTSTVLRSASVVEVQASTGAGEAQSYYSLFSPNRTEYTVSFACPSVDVTVPSTANPNRGRGRQDTQKLNSPFEVRSGAQDSVWKLLVQMWDQRVFASRGPVVLDGPLTGDLRLDGGTLRGELTNQTGLTLTGSVLLFRRMAEAVGDIPAGGSQAVDWTSGFGSPLPEPDPGPFAGKRDSQSGMPMRAYGPTPVPSAPSIGAPLQSLLTGPLRKEGTRDVEEPVYVALKEGYLNRSGYAPSDREALLLAWATTDPLGAKLSGSRAPRSEAATLVIIHIPVVTPEPPRAAPAPSAEGAGTQPTSPPPPPLPSPAAR